MGTEPRTAGYPVMPRPFLSIPRPRRRRRAAGLLFALVVMAGPAMTPVTWAAPAAAAPVTTSADASPSWLARLGGAILDAAGDPEVWGPLVAAGALGVSGVDGSLADWAADTAPVFGTAARARDVSDVLLRGSEHALIVGTVLLTYDDDPLRWAWAAGEETLVGAGATWLTRRGTGRLKQSTGRWRPDLTDTRSFPSGHTSSTTVRLTLLRRQAARARLSPAARLAVDVGATTMAAACAWARVEGRKHHLSDVLAGYALGRFVGRLVHDAWFGPAGLDDARLSVASGREGIGLRVSLAF
jgi:membrane-associated phospholipid phosphatase